jgi:hypothetical protein
MSLTLEKTSPTVEHWLHTMYGIRPGRSVPTRSATMTYSYPEGIADWLHRMCGIAITKSR